MLDHTREMMHRDRRITQSLIGFALALLLGAVLWLSFARYL